LVDEGGGDVAEFAVGVLGDRGQDREGLIALQRRSPIRMPLACSMTARESMTLLICSDRAVVVT